MTKSGAFRTLESLRSMGVVVGVSLVLGLGGVQYVNVYRGQQLAIERIEAQYTRLQSLTRQHEEWLKNHDVLSGVMARVAYASSATTERVHADMLQRFRQLADQAGMQVMGSQNLQTSEEEGLMLVPMSVTLSGDIEALVQLLAALSIDYPLILVDAMDIRPEARVVASNEPQSLRITMRLQAIRRGA